MLVYSCSAIRDSFCRLISVEPWYAGGGVRETGARRAGEGPGIVLLDDGLGVPMIFISAV
jgi:hypothetical protein